MSLKDLNEYLEYTEDPEMDLEVKANKEWNDNYIKSIDKEYTKYRDMMYYILKNNDVDFIYNENQNTYTIFFTNKIDYNKFMSREKNSKRFNTCLRMNLDNTSFEKLPRDYDTDKRYIRLWIKDGI